jgi:hypothetical protein
MQHDIRPAKIDCVFCWRTATGEVGDGVRDTSFSGRPVPYRPDARRMGEGLRTRVEGRACPHRPTGFRLADQGAISRMCSFVAGDVTHPTLVPSRNARELEVLRDAARGAVLSGDGGEWSLAAIHAGPREWLAIHIGAQPSVVASFARRVKAPWTLRIREVVAKTPKGRGSRLKGAPLPRSQGARPRDPRRGHAFRRGAAPCERSVRGRRRSRTRGVDPRPPRVHRRVQEDFAAQLFGLEPPKRGRRS